jgi:hypothetical protein
MDITQAANILAENNAQCTYDVYVPSLNASVAFKSMTVGQYKTMAKAAITSEAKFNEYIAHLILVLSDNGVNLSELNAIDKIYILSGIKYKGAPPSQGIGVRCQDCDQIHEDIEIFETFLTEDVTTHTANITYEINGLTVSMDIGMPSIKDVLEYENYVGNKYINSDLDDTEIRTAIVMGEFESKLMCVREITINGELVEGYRDLELSRKFSILSSISNEYFDVELVNKMIEDNIRNIQRDITCTNCDAKIEYIIDVADFFL